MSDKKKKGIIIPQEKLSKEVLHSLIEEFILREGTDYGNVEYSLEQKKEHILNQLKSRKILILFDPVLENTNLVTFDEITKLNQQHYDILGLS